MRVMWLGTYERAYPRSRVLIAGLRELGVEVVEHHRPVWERRRHKAGGPAAPAARRPPPGASPAPGPAWRARGPRERPVDAIVAGYPAQPDALPAWCVARARRVPLVVDMMISLADTLGGDRALAGRGAAARARGRRPDEPAARRPRAGRHPRRAPTGWRARFGIARSRIAVVPVGAEPERFPPRARAAGPPARALLRQARPAPRRRHGARGRPRARACRRCG